MADSEFGQLYATLVMDNQVSPQLRQIVEDLRLVNDSIKETRNLFSAYSEIKISHPVNELEKNWRSMREAVADVRTEISKTQGKMQDLDNLGLGSSSQYRQYEEKLRQLIRLRDELLSYGDKGKNAGLMGSEDISRFKGEFQVLKKEIADTDVQSKRLVATQQQNVSAAERMVQQYGKVAQELAAVRQTALDSGETVMGTQFMQNTINRIQTAMQALQQVLSDPSSITTNMMERFTQQFNHLTKMATDQAKHMRDALSAKSIMADSETALTRMESKLEAIKNKLRSIKETKGLENINTSGLEAVQTRLENFINTYRNALQSGNINETVAAKLAQKFRQISADADLASKKIDGLAAAQRRAAAATAQTARAYDPILQKMQQLQSATTRTGRIWEQFKTQIAFTAFSIYGIESFLKNVITIGGEFERQRVALQNMLGDMREASEIFGQLKNLALESPFTFRQLSTYTKQLAAFSIPYEELFDTNRRLSDMSAGLGVDMSRLILAYGQVRAATVLRGQELRQFTEAGVPMVEKLADYFTQLNGQLVTTKDIFKMISAKQVPFEAVKQVMMEMTDEGGMFYNMQAKIADTLSGRWGNLKDAWEIMLGTLADSESIMGKSLKWLVELLTAVIRHLTTISGILGGMAIAKMFKSLGVITSLSFGSTATGGLDKYFLKAKQLRAIELQRIALTRQLEPIERDILNYRNKITVADRISMLNNGQLNKYQATLLVRSGQLNSATAMRLALERGITSEEIRQLGQMSKTSLKFKSFWSSFAGGINWAGLGITAGIMALGAGIGYFVQKSNELREAQKTAAEELKTTNEDIYKFLSTNKLSSGMSNDEALRAIEKYDEELKKVAPNYLEIKSKIVGEHGESPQDQAQAYYQALQDAMNGAYEASQKGTTSRIIELNDLPGWDNANDLFNREARSARDLRETINSLAPQRIIELANGMANLSNETKKAVAELVKAGKKVDALELMSRGPNYNFNALGISSLLGTSTAGWTYDNADEFVEKVVGVIKNSWSEYFTNGKFDSNHRMADAAKSGILQSLRDAISTLGYDDVAAKNLTMSVESGLFGQSQTATQMLVDQFVSANALQKDKIIAALKDSGQSLPKEIEEQLKAQANVIGFTNGRFREQITEIFNHPIDLVQMLRVSLNMDLALPDWQKQMIEDFGEQYATVIKASPDIPSAIEAINKLYKEAREKMDSFKSLMLRVGIHFTGGNLPEQAPSGLAGWFKGLYSGFREQVNSTLDTINSYKANKDKWGITEPPVSGSKKPKKTGGGKKEDKELQAWKAHVDLYKKFLDQYRDLTKMWGEKKALDTLKSSEAYEWIVDFAKTKGINLTDIDAMNDALTGLLDVNKGDKQKRKEALAKRIADLEAEGYKRAADELKRVNATLDEQLKILNEEYDAYKKIFLITGNKEGAMQLAFGGQVTNERYVDDLTSRLKKELSKIGSGKSIDEVLGMTKDEINSAFGEDSTAANLINKLKEERNKLEKEYLDALATALSSDMTLEDKRAEAQRKHNEQLEKLIELREKDQELADKAIEAENRRYNREDAGYEEQIFERDTNLSGLLNNAEVLSKGYLRAILVRLRDSVSRYANDNTPEGIAARKKLEEQIMKVSDALGDLHDNVVNVEEDFYTGGDGNRHIRGVTATRYNFNQDQVVDEATETRIKTSEKFRKLSSDIDKASKAFKELENILKPVIDLLDALGMEDTPFGQAVTGASNALSAASSTAGAFGTLAQVAGPESGIGGLLSAAGPYGAAAAAALSVATTIFQMHDKALQKEIEASEARQKEFEDIADNLERVLERTLGDIYSARIDERTSDKYRLVIGGSTQLYDSNLDFWDWVEAAQKFGFYTKEAVNAMKDALQSGTFYDASKAALFAQRDELQHQLDLERQKKKSDDSVISDLEQKLIEMDDLIEYYAMDMAKELYDIDIKSWSQSLAEAIIDAWAKGEDAVEAYKDKVKEIMRDLAVNIVSKKFIETLMKPVEDFITSEMEEKSGMLDEYSIAKIAELTSEAAQQATDLTYNFLDKLKGLGIDLSESDENASTLGKGIASITEDTADLLASYINAICADVAALRALEERVVESGFAETNATLMLQLTELRNICSFVERNAIAAERIYDLFDSVTTVSGSGRKVRV